MNQFYIPDSVALLIIVAVCTWLGYRIVKVSEDNYKHWRANHNNYNSQH